MKIMLTKKKVSLVQAVAVVIVVAVIAYAIGYDIGFEAALR